MAEMEKIDSVKDTKFVDLEEAKKRKSNAESDTETPYRGYGFTEVFLKYV